MEDFCAELSLNIQEIKSSLIILQKAIQSDDSDISYNNIDDCLEIAVEKISNVANFIETFQKNNL